MNFTNFAKSQIVVAPDPATEGTTFTITTGDGDLKFPEAPFNLTCFPPGVSANYYNAEIVSVNNRTGDVFTFSRQAENSLSQDIGAGWQVQIGVTAGLLTSLEGAQGSQGAPAKYNLQMTIVFQNNGWHTGVQEAICQFNEGNDGGSFAVGDYVTITDGTNYIIAQITNFTVNNNVWTFIYDGLISYGSGSFTVANILLTGQPGLQGAQGANGTNGAQGSQGATGSNGAQGAAGANGPQGPQGSVGATGPQGPQGSGAVGFAPVAGNYYPVDAGSFTDVSFANGQLYAVPFSLSVAHTFTQIAAFVNTAGGTGAVLRMGIYSDNGGTPVGGALVLDAGTIAATTNGQRLEVTINQTLQPGNYWIACVTQGGASPVPQVQASSGSNNSIMGVADPYSGASSSAGFYSTATTYTGALPSTFPAASPCNGAAGQASAPSVFIRA